MKICGIIAEFNPLHNGHKFLIDEAKKEADAVVSVMSGSFVQRGDVAIFDKWTRAKAAILSGVDLVIELPVVYSASPAERFAYGAVELLNSLKCIDTLLFGSESGDIELLKNSARHLLEETKEISEKLQKELSSGQSFPKARQIAYEGIIPDDILSNPNNILALEYIKALEKQKSNIIPKTISRVDNGYHSFDDKDVFLGATAIRDLISENKSFLKYIPENLIGLYEDASIYNFECLSDTLFYVLRTTSPDKLKTYFGIDEGLENKLAELAIKTDNIHDLIDKATSKRYPKTRIKRALVSILLKIDKDLPFYHNSYIRVLAFNNKGREILNLIKENSSLPIITKLADFKEENQLLEKDILSTDIFSLCAFDKNKKTGKMDFTISPVYLDI